MSRWERTGVRDIAFSGWHRERFDDDCKAFDLDLVGICHRCDQPLYVIEDTHLAGFKPTKWTCRIAMMLNVPAYLVRYTNDGDELTSLTATLMVPFQSERRIGDAAAFEIHLKTLRRNHCEVWHPEQRSLFAPGEEPF